MGGESRPRWRAEDDILVLDESPKDRFGTTEPTTYPDRLIKLSGRWVDRVEQIARWPYHPRSYTISILNESFVSLRCLLREPPWESFSEPV